MTRRPTAAPRVLFALGFRPFFLAAGVAGVGLTLAWLAVLHGRLPAPPWLDPFLWHGHEMLFGLVQAAIAGFLLTSVPVWTGTPPVRGTRLAGLLGLWAIGRGAMALAGWLPPGAVATLDLAFPVALLLAVGTPILRVRATRQLGILAVLLGLTAANAASHLDALGGAPGVGRVALYGASFFVALLILVIGGRITPAFTRNAMQRAGATGAVRMNPWLDWLALGSAAALAAAEVLAPRSTASGLVAGIAALAVAARMAGWQTRFALRDPLLASLHAGHAWLALGFAALAASDLGAPLPRSVAVHALTAGAMGTMILAVMTRVALGHTGRPLVAPPAANTAYVLVTLGAGVRVIGPLLAPQAQLIPWTLGGLLWAGAFVSFLWGYAGVLLRPRVDGKPG
jgi:uncharacterized protein involved in response to NO